MMLSIFTPCYRLGFTPRLGWVQATTNDCPWSSWPTAFPRVTAICEPERGINNVKELLTWQGGNTFWFEFFYLLQATFSRGCKAFLLNLAELSDGSLMFSFGSSHHSGNTKRANSFSLLYAQNVTSTKNSFPKRMPSNFKKKSPIPIAPARKTGKSIRVLRQKDTGSGKVQDRFDSEKVTGEADNVNHNKRGYGLSQRSSSAYVKRSSLPSLKERESSEKNKSYKSSIADDIIKRIRCSPEPNRSYNSSAAADIIKRIWASVSKDNSANGEKNDNLSSKFKFRKSTDSLLPLWRQNPDKTKGEFKEDGSKRHSSIQDEKRPTRIASSRGGPSKHTFEKTSKIVEKSQPETFVLSRSSSKFVRRSPVPLSAIKQYIRPVPGTQVSESTLTRENEGISRDSAGTSTNMENGSVVKDMPSLSEGQQNDLNELKLTELKKMAKTCGLKGYSTLRKGELLELLRITIKP